MTAARLPWTLPAVSRLEGRLAVWVDAARWPAGGPLGELRWAGAATESGAQLALRVGEPSSVALAVTLAGDGGGPLAPASAIAIIPWSLAIALVESVLGPAGELAAPRPPTTVERAIVAAAVADTLARAGVAAEVALTPPPAPAVPCAVVRLAVLRPRAAELAVIVPATPAVRTRPLAELLPLRAPRLPPVTAWIELASGRLPREAAGRLAALGRGDVIVVGPPAPAARVARGRVRGALDLAAGTLTVTGGYLRMDAQADALADDLSISLAVVAGEVAVSARALLELSPGAVLPLGRPLTGAVELWADGRRIGRGELVDVDGALGVRIAELTHDHPRTGVTAPVASASTPPSPAAAR